MSHAINTLLGLVLLCSGFIAIPWVLTVRFTPEIKRRRIHKWLLAWSVKGCLAPLAFWGVMNLGLGWNLQPFMPEIQAAQNHGGNWVPEYLCVLANGVFIASSYWSAVTLSWLLISAARGAEVGSLREFKILGLTWLVVLGVPAALLIWFGGLPLAGLSLSLVLTPLASGAREVLAPRKLPPMYSKAVARIKFGKYADAEWEILKELESWDDDFEGWMMLAELYANHFNDLAEAERTIRELCDQPTTTASQVSVALHRLAEWQLKIALDPEAARRSLQIVCDRYKGTHLARMAQLRINQFPVTAAELREQQAARPIPLPALGDALDQAPAASATGTERGRAAKLANACVEQLKANPNNVVIREKFARTLVEQLDRPLLGIEQIELLLDLPERSDAERAEWLGLIAAWHLKYRHDPQSGRRILEKLLADFPNTAQAFAARRRLELLDREHKNRLD